MNQRTFDPEALVKFSDTKPVVTEIVETRPNTSVAYTVSPQAFNPTHSEPASTGAHSVSSGSNIPRSSNA